MSVLRKLVCMVLALALIGAWLGILLGIPWAEAAAWLGGGGVVAAVAAVGVRR